MLARFECPRCQTVFTHEKGDDEAFFECPSCGALAMSIGEATGVDSSALARALSSSHQSSSQSQSGLEDTEAPSPESLPGSLDSHESPEPSTPIDRVDPFVAGAAGIFAGLMERPMAAVPLSSDPPAGSDGKTLKPAGHSPGLDLSLDLGLDEDLKDFALPATAARAASSSQKKTQEKKSTKQANPSSSSAQPPPSASIPAVSAGLGGSLGDEAFGDLEAAFDVMAAKPTGSIARGNHGLSEDDRRFLAGVAHAEEPPPAPQNSPKRPPARPAPRPPPRATKRASQPDRSKGLSLSLEARNAAFISLRPGNRQASVLPAERPSSTTQEHPSPSQSASSTAAAGGDTATDVSASSPTPTPRQKPSVMGGLPAFVLMLAVLFGLGIGAAAGALTAPVAVKRNDARARAELQFAEGNQFYDEGRFDDALGKFRGAVNIDRTFALAHRAKGAALAKQLRFDEAAAAYQEYLGLESSAIDAVDVKEALARRGVAADLPGGP